MKKVKYIALVAFLGIIYSCQEEVIEPEIIEEEIPQIEGMYVGIFSVYNQDADSTQWDSTSVDFENGLFENPMNPSHLPLGGEGILSVFSDSLEFSQNNAWPAIYDWNLYLDGSYEYELLQNHLVFHKTNAGNIYKYDLYLE